MRAVWPQLGPQRLAEVARSLGAEGFRVEQPDAFLPALKDAIAVTEQGRPVLIECITKEGYDFSRYD